MNEEYKVITKDGRKDFEKEINKLARKGWYKCEGDLAIIFESRTNVFWYSTIMWRYVKET